MKDTERHVLFSFCLFCCENVSHFLAYMFLSCSQSDLFGFIYEQMTAADKCDRKVNEQPSCTADGPALLGPWLHGGGGLNKRGVCDIFCENERMCLCSRSAYIDPSFLFPAYFPLLYPGRSTHVTLKVYTLTSSKIQIQKAHVTLYYSLSILHGPYWRGGTDWQFQF